MAEQRLREQIAIHLAFTIRYFDPSLPMRTKWSEFSKAEQTALLEQAEPIFTFIKEALPGMAKEAGYVKLADDQTLPTKPRCGQSMSDKDYGDRREVIGYNTALTDMLKAGWRKVEP